MRAWEKSHRASLRHVARSRTMGGHVVMTGFVPILRANDQ